MYIYHDRINDVYTPYGNLKILADETDISYHTLQNHFTRAKKERYITKDAEVIVKSKLIKSKVKKK